MPEPLELSIQDANHLLSTEGRAVLIDVREPWEFALAKLPDSCLIPMGSVPAELQRLDGLAENKTLLLLCHHGVRSLQVTAWLRDKGIDDCYSVAGGIDRWSRQIDQSIPLY